MMDHEEFIDQTRLNLLDNHALRLSEAETQNAVEAVLQTLAEQLPEETRATMAEKVPPALQDFWSEAGTAAPLYTLDEFFQRIAERETINVTVAAYYASAVLDTLSETLSSDDLEALRAALPQRFRPLFERQGDEWNLTL